jgi:hypothetical protein
LQVAMRSATLTADPWPFTPQSIPESEVAQGNNRKSGRAPVPLAELLDHSRSPAPNLFTLLLSPSP